METLRVRAAESVPTWTVLVFSAAILYQVSHWMEHMIQVYQHAMLGIIISHSHGALFFLDLEWNHFMFNLLYFAALVLVFFGGMWFTKIRFRTYPLVSVFLGLSVLVEGWHFLEHSVRLYQHVLIGCEPCAGILGASVDIVYLHATYNTLTWILPLTAYLAGGYYRRMWNML
jgi:hypothetical protein